MQKEKNLILRYSLLTIFSIFFISEIFLKIMTILITYLTGFITSIFTQTVVQTSSLHFPNHNTTMLIVEECIAQSAYFLLSIVFFSTPVKLKLLLKTWLKSLLIFTIFNILRILILILVFLNFGQYQFEKVHLIFYQLLSGLVVAIIAIYYLNKLKLKKIYPIISDYKYLLQNFLPKTKKTKKN